MENIGDWLYIVIIIIAAISSIFSSVRKKAKQVSSQQTQQTHRPQHTQQREIIDDDVFEDDYWGKKQTFDLEPAPVVIPKPSAMPLQHSTPKQSASTFIKSQEGQRLIIKDNMDSIFAENEAEQASFTLEDLPSDAEEWRKVLLYNEIYNRKY